MYSTIDRVVTGGLLFFVVFWVIGISQDTRAIKADFAAIRKVAVEGASCPTNTIEKTVGREKE